jgi:hypothetical protein
MRQTRDDASINGQRQSQEARSQAKPSYVRTVWIAGDVAGGHHKHPVVERLLLLGWLFVVLLCKERVVCGRKGWVVGVGERGGERERETPRRDRLDRPVSLFDE